MKLVEFTPPKGFTPPEGTDEFDQLATFRRKPNGKMCIIAIGGVPMPGYKESPSKEVGETAANRYREKMTGMEGGAVSGAGMAY